MYPFIQDLAFSIRFLRRSPGFTYIAILTLTLGIAGNIIVFSFINATLLARLPYSEPQRLMILRWQDQSDLPALVFFMVKERARSFSSVAAFYPVDVGVNISTTGPPQYVKALSVSKDLFPLLGIQPEIGTTFTTEDDQPKASPTAILSYGLWLQSFNRDPSAIGRNLQINGENYKIIGVMPQAFRFYPDADVWLPLRITPGAVGQGSNYRVVGRLADGSSQQQAQFELDGLTREFRAAHPDSPRKGNLIPQKLQDFLVAGEREGLAILFAAVAFVFLIACTNAAILILVRAAGSTNAIAIRAALGPTRRRLVLSLLTESLVLSLTAGVLGLILVKESLPLVMKLWPADLPLAAKLRIDGNVVLFTLAVAVLSPLLFGLAPALKLARVNIAQVLARTSRTASASSEQVRAVRFLVFGQMALTVMLLAGTILLAKSLRNLYSVPLGFDPDRLIVAQVSLANERYGATAPTDQLLEQVVARIESLPGVDSAAAANGMPMEKGLNLTLHPVGAPPMLDHDDEYRTVTFDYFKTLRIALRSGRLFTANDFSGTTPVAIINENMARRWWPNTSAVGRFIQVDRELGAEFSDVPRQIVGVVADVHEKGPDMPPPTTVFVPMGQTPDHITAFSNQAFLTSIVVHTSARVDLSSQIRHAIQSIDPSLPLASFQPFSKVIDRSLANQRFMALLTAGFSLFALLLTGIGMHGLLNYQARLRTREIAIRMAVGASRSHVIGTVVKQGAKLISFAVLVGLAGSFIIKRLLGSLLYNVQGSSVVLIFATGFLLGLAATLICLMTAVRAASVEPMAVLRNE